MSIIDTIIYFKGTNICRYLFSRGLFSQTTETKFRFVGVYFCKWGQGQISRVLIFTNRENIFILKIKNDQCELLDGK